MGSGLEPGSAPDQLGELDWLGLRDARLHDGRHTAATMLLLQGVDDQTVMAVMVGRTVAWSSVTNM
jgi:hypothetical protein